MSTLARGCFRPTEAEVAEINVDMAADNEPLTDADELEAAHLAGVVTRGEIPARGWELLCSNPKVERQARAAMRDRLVVGLLLKGKLPLTGGVP